MALPLSMFEGRRRNACCEPGNCEYRLGRVRSYVMALITARMVNEDPVAVLHKILTDSDKETNLVQFSSRPGSHGQKARDIVLSLEIVRDQQHIPLTIANLSRIAQALCPFSMEDC